GSVLRHIQARLAKAAWRNGSIGDRTRHARRHYKASKPVGRGAAVLYRRERRPAKIGRVARDGGRSERVDPGQVRRGKGQAERYDQGRVFGGMVSAVEIRRQEGRLGLAEFSQRSMGIERVPVLGRDTGGDWHRPGAGQLSFSAGDPAESEAAA